MASSSSEVGVGDRIRVGEDEESDGDTGEGSTAGSSADRPQGAGHTPCTPAGDTPDEGWHRDCGAGTGSQEACEVHKGELLQFYCNTCSMLICSKGMSTLHRGHGRVPAQVRAEDLQQTMQGHVTRLDQCASNTEELIQEWRDAGKQDERCINNMMKLVETERDELKSRLDEYAAGILQRLKTESEESEAKKREKTLFLEGQLAHIGQLKNDIQQFLEPDVAAEHVISSNRELELRVDRFCSGEWREKPDLVTFSLSSPPDDIEDIMSTLFGKLSISVSSSDPPGSDFEPDIISNASPELSGDLSSCSVAFESTNETSPENPEELTEAEVAEPQPNEDIMASPTSFEARCSNDKTSVWLRDIACIEDTITLVDYKNSNVKLFSTTGEFVKTSSPGLFVHPHKVTAFPGQPTKVLVIDEGSENCGVSWWDIDTEEKKSFLMDGTKAPFKSVRAVAVTRLGDEMVVAVADGQRPLIQCFSLEGEFVAKRRIKQSDVWYMAGHGDHDLLVVNHEGSSLQAYRAGQQAWNWRPPDGSHRLQGLCVSQAAHTLVADYNTHQVFQVSQAGLMIRAVLTWQHGLEKPWGVTQCEQSNLLAVTDHKGHVHTVQLSM